MFESKNIYSRLWLLSPCSSFLQIVYIIMLNFRGHDTVPLVWIKQATPQSQIEHPTTESLWSSFLQIVYVIMLKFCVH